jgi:hypothetical protein
MGLKGNTNNTLISATKNLSRNKRIPKIIENQILKALAHYPELKRTHIRFVFTRKLKSSIMAARPVVHTLLGPRDKRTYEILIKPVLKLTHTIQPIHRISDEVLIGWIGHELGHIMDYEQRSTFSVAKFGLLYLISKRYIRKAERVADTFAVNRGMSSYILATKDYILSSSELPQKYKDKIAKLYLSPDDIVELVAKMEEKKSNESREELIKEETDIVEEIKS